MWRAAVSLVVLLNLTAPAAAGQDAAFPAPGGSSSTTFSVEPLTTEGSSAASPAVFSRDNLGRATIQAVSLAEPLKIDGILEEELYTDVPAVSDFIQTEPREGDPATEKTELWVSFDEDHVYVSFRCWESEPGRMVANEMRRDSNVIWQGNDLVGFMFDTFYDRRNAVLFTVNALGGRQDGQVTNERQWSGDWNPVWEVQTRRFEEGWTVEAALPFKSLRYGPGRDQIWGFNALRVNRWKNEIALLMLGPSGRGQMGLQHSSMAATLTGLEVPPGSRNLEVKPYFISSLRTDRDSTPPISNKLNGDAGLDVKYGLTQNWTADFTYNTDFAQVEADEQQVNLTRFSLFFPEKRDFFLENQGLFSFGGANAGGQANSSDTPILFYSRRIGIHENRIVPIQAGGRLTGRFQRYSFGFLNIRSGAEPVSEAPPTNFAVARVKRDILRKSSAGLIFTGRSAALNSPGGNTVYGADASFGFFENLTINSYWARTRTQGLTGGDTSYRTQLDYNGDRYGVQLERLSVGDDFNPEIGFVRRDDMRRNFAQLRFSPRPERIESIRKFSWTASADYTENGTGRVETREFTGEFAIEFENSDRFSLAYADTFEYLPRPFDIAREITLPVGGYNHNRLRAGFNLSPQRRISAQFAAEHGRFYTGHKTTFSVGRGRANLASRFSVEPSYSANWIDLAEGSFTTHLAGSRLTYTATPLMFVSALVQYNSGINAVTANIRLRWEYRPGSELFIVYNEERDTLGRNFPDLANRALIVKVNRLLRF